MKNVGSTMFLFDVCMDVCMQLFMDCIVALLIVYRCTEFCDSSSKFHKLGRSHVHKAFLPWQVLLVPHSTGNHNGTCPPKGLSGHKV